MLALVTRDPAETNPDHYKVVFENDRVRVLEYRDEPGARTTPHDHPDSVMYTLSSFRRRLVSDDAEREVELSAGSVGWLPAQSHHGENIGDTPTHVIFVELKEQSRHDGVGSEKQPPLPGPQ
jgi:quercetin dioxygenase-like cupin family protein